MTEDPMQGDDWVPEACTLPTLEQPLRRAEFDDLFAIDVIAVAQESPQRVRLDLRAEPSTAARAAEFAAMETDCCSFFTFDLAISNGQVSMVIGTGAAHEAVLAAVAARAEARLGAVA
jgi:hypothetical protein